MAQIPKLKRVSVTSAGQLERWFIRNPDIPGPIMLVLTTDPDTPAHDCVASVQTTLANHGWTAGFRYTLTPTRTGQVISRVQATA